MLDGHRELERVLDCGRIIAEIHRCDRGSRCGVVVPVLRGRKSSLGVGGRLTPGFVDDARESSGIGTVLDPDTVEVQPPEIDRKGRKSEQYGEQERHQDDRGTGLRLVGVFEDGTQLLARSHAPPHGPVPNVSGSSLTSARSEKSRSR